MRKAASCTPARRCRKSTVLAGKTGLGKTPSDRNGAVQTRKPRFVGIKAFGIGRSDWNRSSDLFVTNETRYQAALRSMFVRRHFTSTSFLHKGVCRKAFCHPL